MAVSKNVRQPWLVHGAGVSVGGGVLFFFTSPIEPESGSREHRRTVRILRQIASSLSRFRFWYCPAFSVQLCGMPRRDENMNVEKVKNRGELSYRLDLRWPQMRPGITVLTRPFIELHRLIHYFCVDLHAVSDLVLQATAYKINKVSSSA